MLQIDDEWRLKNNNNKERFKNIYIFLKKSREWNKKYVGVDIKKWVAKIKNYIFWLDRIIPLIVENTLRVGSNCKD